MAGGVPVGVPVDVDDVLVGVTAGVPWVATMRSRQRRSGEMGKAVHTTVRGTECGGAGGQQRTRTSTRRSWSR